MLITPLTNTAPPVAATSLPPTTRNTISSPDTPRAPRCVTPGRESGRVIPPPARRATTVLQPSAHAAVGAERPNMPPSGRNARTCRHLGFHPIRAQALLYSRGCIAVSGRTSGGAGIMSPV